MAANNVSFIGGAARRVVLLRNPRYFLLTGGARARRPEQGHLPDARHPGEPPHRADVLVVPSSDMADRVGSALPHLSDRLVVRYHPLVATARRPPSSAHSPLPSLSLHSGGAQGSSSGNPTTWPPQSNR